MSRLIAEMSDAKDRHVRKAEGFNMAGEVTLANRNQAAARALRDAIRAIEAADRAETEAV